MTKNDGGVTLKGNQHNWWPRILKKILTKQTMSRKEFTYYREITKDKEFTCHSRMMFANREVVHV